MPGVIEFCAGAGGLSLGLEKAGFKPVALVDNDIHACATLRQNRPLWNTIQADIKTFNVSAWAGVDLVCGGLPCPPYSLAGKQQGANDERDLFPEMLRIVCQAQPKAILIENVRGLMHTKFAVMRARIDQALNDMGYNPYWAMFDAADFGAPQTRTRVFLIGLKKGATNPISWPFKLKKMPMTVGEAVGDLMAANGWKGATQWARQANKVAPTIIGGSKKHGGPDLGPTRARKAWAEIGVDGLGVADCAPDIDFDGMPRLTARMIARIQGFPDSWHFYGGKTQQCRQIGNALPPPLAEAVAVEVARCLL